MKTVFFLLATLFVFANCTIQRRTVNKGFYVKWHNSLRTESKKELTTKNIVSNEITSSPLVDSIKEKTQEEDIEILSEFASKNITAIDETEIESVENPQIILDDEKKEKTSHIETHAKPHSTKVKTKKKEIKEKKDLALRIHQLFTISIACMFIGMICFFIGFASNYINWVAILAGIFGTGGYLLFLFSLLLLLYYLIFKRMSSPKIAIHNLYRYEK